MSQREKKCLELLIINNSDHSNRKSTRFLWETKLDYYDIFKIATSYAAVKLGNIFKACKKKM